MWRWIVLVFGSVVVAALVFWIAQVVTLRTKFPPAVRAIRRFNRVLMNPRAMKVAGQPGAYASVIRHVGRVTGKSYETPVGVLGNQGGFVIALPYGSSPDWLKNVLASGAAVIVNEGNVFQVGDPELVAIQNVNHLFSQKDRWVHRFYGVDQFLSLRRVGAGTV